MADFASVFENQSNTATEQELDAGGQSKEDTDDSVFYREDEEIPQQILDPVWAPRSGEPIWPEKLHSAPQIHISESQAACHGTELMDANFELDSVAVLQGMKRKMDKKLNESPTDTDVHNETAANSRKITHTEELSASPVEPLRASNPAEAAQMKERANTYTDENSCFSPGGSGETGLPVESSVCVEEVQEEHGLDMTCDSDNKSFNHLTHTKYGTVSYRRIRRGQTRKRIEMFESMMQL